MYNYTYSTKERGLPECIGYQWSFTFYLHCARAPLRYSQTLHTTALGGEKTTSFCERHDCISSRLIPKPGKQPGQRGWGQPVYTCMHVHYFSEGVGMPMNFGRTFPLSVYGSYSMTDCYVRMLRISMNSITHTCSFSMICSPAHDYFITGCVFAIAVHVLYFLKTSPIHTCSCLLMCWAGNEDSEHIK